MTPSNFEETESEQNITFDARQGRTKLLLYWLGELTMSQAQQNYMGWLNSLKGLYYICFPYVKEKEALEVKNLISKAENQVSLYIRKVKISSDVVVKSLDVATEKALIVFKDQFMQTSNKDDGGFDPSKFDGD